jgi:hypothetical protein
MSGSQLGRLVIVFVVIVLLAFVGGYGLGYKEGWDRPAPRVYRTQLPRSEWEEPLPPSLPTGDRIQFRDDSGLVIATTSTTDSNGRGTITVGAGTFSFRVLHEDSTPTAFVATSDEQFRVGLVQQDADPTLYVLCVDDGPAPNWGRLVMGFGPGWGEWSAAADYLPQDSVTFVMGWEPGTLTVKKGGTLQTNTFVDMVLIYATPTDNLESWWQPAYPYDGLTGSPPVRDAGTNKGRWRTNGSGEVEWFDPGGTTSDPIFPRGMGALCHREQDRWPGADVPERVLTELRLYYLQESVEITEGANAELDTEGVSITVNGPANAEVSLLWEGSIERPISGLTLDGAGTGTQTGLPPGYYIIRGYHASDTTKYVAPVEVQASDVGGSYTANLAGSWSTVAASTYTGIIYAYDLVACEGATLWALLTVPTTHWEAVATTDSGGAYSFVGTPGIDNIVVTHPTWGACSFDVSGVSACWFSPQLSARFGAVVSSHEVAEPEGVSWWGVAGDHDNLPCRNRMAYVKNNTTGEEYQIGSATHTGGVISDPCPRWRWTPPADGSTVAATASQYTYSLYDQDGTLLAGSLGLAGDTAPPWADPTFWYELSNTGKRISASVGGKAKGVGWRADRQSLIPETLREVTRLGGEFGYWDGPLEHRFDTNDLTGRLILTFDSWECPYCGGPTWFSPDTASYTRYECMQCRDESIITDCRAYFLTRALQAFTTWKNTVVKAWTNGHAIALLVDGWPRPEVYDEDAGFLVTDWLGLGIDRWVFQHADFGSWTGGAWVDGDSVADIEATLSRTVGPMMLKVHMAASDAAGCSLFITATKPGGGAKVLPVTIPPGSAEGDLIPVDWHPHHAYALGYYTDVTNVVGGTESLEADIWSDGPAWRSSEGIAVPSNGEELWACDIELGTAVHCRRDAAGIVWLTYTSGGRIYVRSLDEAAGTMTAPKRVTSEHGYSYPRIAPMRDGSLQVYAYAEGRGITARFYSLDRAETWTA